MGTCKHGNLYCGGIEKYQTTGPCFHCLKELFKERDELRKVVDSKLHMRQCHDCGMRFYAADAITPYCLCPNCKSQDTRLVKKGVM